MTIAIETNKISYTATSGLLIFPYPFKILADTDLLVIVRDVYGTEHTQAITTNYTVDGEGVATGGNVTFVTAPYTTYGAGAIVWITRDLPYTQDADLLEGGAMPAETFEDTLDKGVMLIQQLKDETDRTFKVPVTDVTTDMDFPDPLLNPGKVLGMNAAGTGLTTYDVDDAVTINLDLASNYTDLDDLCTDVGATETTVLVTTTLDCPKTRTVGSNIKFEFRYPGCLNITATKVVTITRKPVMPKYQVFTGTGTVVFSGDIPTGGAVEWWGGKNDRTTDCTAAINALYASGIRTWVPGHGVYSHTGFNLYTDCSILGFGQHTSILEYLSATGDAITLAAVSPSTIHRRSRIRDIEMSSDALRTTGWAINTVTGEQQADIEISHINIQGYDNGVWINYPCQGNLSYVRCDLNGKTVAGSIGIQIGSAPNKALDMTLVAPYITAVETCFVIYGYVNKIIKPIWESCDTGLKVYGYVSVDTPYQNADTLDIYVYNNSGYGNLFIVGAVAAAGGGPTITYETDAVKNRTVYLPVAFSSSNPARIGPYDFGVQFMANFTKVATYRSSALTLFDTVWTDIAFDVDSEDELAECAAGAVTVGSAGFYDITVQVGFTTPSDGARLSVAIYKNGTAVASAENAVGAAAAYPTVSVSRKIRLAANDVIKGYARSTGGGGAVGVQTGATVTFMSVMRIF